MQKKGNFFSVFLVFFFLSLFVFLIAKFINPLNLVFSKVAIPVQRYLLVSFINVRSLNDSKNLFNQNLLKQILDYQKVKEQNASLMDQFQTTSIKSQNLLPVNVVGAPGFIPGISQPENLIIDKGSEDIRLGSTVIFKNCIIGKITKISGSLASVTLVTNTSSSFTAKTTGKILGVVKGQGAGEMILDNVLLSENLKVGDLVLTNGDVNLNGGGFPPDLVVGKILSVDKNPSALFQEADLVSLIDFTKLSTVFVLAGNE